MFELRQADPQADIGVLSMEGERSWVPLLETEAREGDPAISPDGQWIAYHSNLSGLFEIYMERVASQEDRQQVSHDGGRVPRWSPDGRELFYMSLDGRQMFAVPVSTDTSPLVGSPSVPVGENFGLPFAFSSELAAPTSLAWIDC